MGIRTRVAGILMASGLALLAGCMQAQTDTPFADRPLEASAAETCAAEGALTPAALEDADSATPEPDSLRKLPKLALDDAIYVLGAPVRWKGRDWAIAGGAVGLIALTALADTEARDAAHSHPDAALDEMTRIVEPFGTGYSWAVLGTYGAVGLIFHNADARDTAIDGVLASVLASGIITPSIKFIVGRARPSQSHDQLSFHPFQSSYSAFPSGHATQAFAVASVISAHSDQFWVSASAYTLASLVAFARVYHGDHWTSDVVAGAAIGTAVGRGVVALNKRIRAGDHTVHISFAPMVGPGMRGAGVTAVF